MIISPGFTGNQLTPVSGKAATTSKSKAKNIKAGAQTPTPNVGSPLNPTTLAGSCRYDSSLGDPEADTSCNCDGVCGAIFSTSLMFGVSTITSMSAILGEILGSDRATEKLLQMYVPFATFGVIAILSGLCPCSERSSNGSSLGAPARKKRV